MTHNSNAFSFSSGVGRNSYGKFFETSGPHVPRDYQIEAAAKLLDGINVLAVLPTGAGKTAILTMFMVI